MFADDLKAKGWVENGGNADYTKGGWEILFDTSSWMTLSTESNPNVFDVHVPTAYESRWTANLIEHLCRMEDERARLRQALASIRALPDAGEAARSVAAEALAQCYHRWLVNVAVPEGRMGRVYCPVCGKTAADHQPE